MARLTALKCLAVAVGFCALVAGPAAFADGQFSPAQKTELGQIIKDYLMKNPEVLRDAITELELKEKTAEADARRKIITDQQGPLYTAPLQEVVGNPAGKLTLIEFFDYNCGYCRKTLGDIARLMKEYPDLKVILKDYPILSDKSIEAAAVALALRNQFDGAKFWEFHQRLLSSHGAVGREEALAIAKDMGADMDRLTKDAASPDIKKDLEANDRIGQKLALNGTPSFVIGDEAVVGAVGYNAMKEKLDNLRKCGKAACS